MMGQIKASFSLDEGIKNEFQTMCDAAGISMSTAIQLFMAECVRSGSFEFHIPVRCSYRNPQGRVPFDEDQN